MIAKYASNIKIDLLTYCDIILYLMLIISNNQDHKVIKYVIDNETFECVIYPHDLAGQLITFENIYDIINNDTIPGVVIEKNIVSIDDCTYDFSIKIEMLNVFKLKEDKTFRLVKKKFSDSQLKNYVMSIISKLETKIIDIDNNDYIHDRPIFVTYFKNNEMHDWLKQFVAEPYDLFEICKKYITQNEGHPYRHIKNFEEYAIQMSLSTYFDHINYANNIDNIKICDKITNFYQFKRWPFLPDCININNIFMQHFIVKHYYKIRNLNNKYQITKLNIPLKSNEFKKIPYVTYMIIQYEKNNMTYKRESRIQDGFPWDKIFDCIKCYHYYHDGYLYKTKDAIVRDKLKHKKYLIEN